MVRQQAELLLLVIVGVLIYLTYSPADSRYFWMYWVSYFRELVDYFRLFLLFRRLFGFSCSSGT